MPSGPRVRFRYAATSSLTPREVDALWQVYQRTFDAERSAFEAAVRQADEVLRFEDARTRELVGMTLVSAWEQEHGGRRVRMLWTGAVCIAPEYRGQNAVQQSGLMRLARERLRHPWSEIWWFWDTFSYKSYLLCPRNLAEYTPKLGEPGGQWELGLLDQLCRRQAGDAYDPERRVIRATGKKLRPGVAEVAPGHPDEHVQYFLQRNPGYQEGERIGVLIPLNLRNVAAIVRATVRRALRGGRKQSRRAVETSAGSGQEEAR